MSSPPVPASTSRLAFASVIGTTLEYYDFAVYNTLAALVFNRIFFPSFDPLTGTLLAFSTYAIGYLSRPAGGFIFGHLGDRRGRRFVLVVTLLVMGVATTLMGLLPTYETAGIASPILLITLRFVQGAALGGEWAGAVLLSVEHGAATQRGRNGSWAQMGPSIGTLLATILIALLSYFMSDATFMAWGWRLPFLLSFALVACGIWIRTGVTETPVFRQLEAEQATLRAPLGEVLSKHRRALVLGGGVRIGSDVLYSITTAFTLSYVTTVLGLSRAMTLTALSIGGVFNAIGMPVFGALSDRFGRRATYAAGLAIALVWSLALFPMLDTKSMTVIVLAYVSGLTIHAMMYGPQAAFIVEQFPPRARYAGASLAYTLAGIVGGGLAPLISAALYKKYATTTAVIAYLAVALSISALALAAAKDRSGQEPGE
jgi:MFS family permease